MRVKFARSGGFAGIAMNRGCEVDTKNLGDAEAEKLRRLVDEARKSDFRTGSEQASSVPDQFYYELEIETNEGAERVELTDMDVTQESMDLIQWLLKRSESPSETEE